MVLAKSLRLVRVPSFGRCVLRSNMRALLLLAAGAHANPCDIYDAAPEKTPCVAAHSEFAPASNRGSGSAAVL